jgi:hypothetical protein
MGAKYQAVAMMLQHISSKSGYDEEVYPEIENELNKNQVYF